MRKPLLLLGLCAAIASGCQSHVTFTADMGGGQPDGFDPGSFTGVGTFEKWGCATASGQALREPVYMLFVLDGSGSMNDDNKWTAVVPALDAIFDSFALRADPAFGVGFKIFADAKDPTISDFSAGPYDWIDVPIAFVDATQRDLLKARVDLTAPYLGTPTYEVLSGQISVLEQFQPMGALLPDGKRVVVFISDGVPDTDMPAGINEVPWSLQLVLDKSMSEPPISTFAVGIGNINPPDLMVYDPVFMSRLAKNGGVSRPGCDPMEALDESKMCHFQITPGGKTPAQITQEFEDAIENIRLRALSCEYPLDIPLSNELVDPTLINVVYTNAAGTATLVPPSMTDGWTYDDPSSPTRVILNGAICDTVKADGAGKIEIVLGCRTIIL